MRQATLVGLQSRSPQSAVQVPAPFDWPFLKSYPLPPIRQLHWQQGTFYPHSCLFAIGLLALHTYNWDIVSVERVTDRDYYSNVCSPSWDFSKCEVLLIHLKYLKLYNSWTLVVVCNGYISTWPSLFLDSLSGPQVLVCSSRMLWHC